MNNELKLMAIKAKSRLLNKGLREIYSSVNIDKPHKTTEAEEIYPNINLSNENERKKQILNMIKRHV